MKSESWNDSKYLSIMCRWNRNRLLIDICFESVEIVDNNIDISPTLDTEITFNLFRNIEPIFFHIKSIVIDLFQSDM